MRSGGELFIKTPNLHELMLEYMWKKMPAEELERKLYGGQEYPENTHMTGFTARTLGSRLREAGFEKVSMQTGVGFDWSNIIARAVKP
jgi:hypothetical protein